MRTANVAPITREAWRTSRAPSDRDTTDIPPSPVNRPTATATICAGKAADSPLRAATPITLPTNARSTMLYRAITMMASIGGKAIFRSSRHIGAVPMASAWDVDCPVFDIVRAAAALRFRWFGYSFEAVGWVIGDASFCWFRWWAGWGVRARGYRSLSAPRPGVLRKVLLRWFVNCAFKGAATQRGGSRCWPVRPFSRKHWTRGLHDAGMRFCADWPLTTG